MNIDLLKKLIEIIMIKIAILKAQLAILLLKEKRTVPNLAGPKHIVCHHSAGDWDIWNVNNHHKDKWGFKSSLGYYLGYHYWISYAGTLYQARRDTEEAAHTVQNGRPYYWNQNSLGICLQGNTDIKPPTSAQLKTLRELLDKKKAEYGIVDKDIFAHREINRTICPGKYLFRWLIKYYPS
ncbi:N-acetylmuramoyl-L-alanine amidase [Patescibacteria group bacterium]|nr:N-acetylmuramoyl-L-alanine amidase [Patescibacteria group bacterium]